MEKIEPIFKNTTKYSKKELNNFLAFHKKKYRRKYLILTGITAIYIISLVIANIINRNWSIALALILVGILIYVYFTNGNQKKLENNKKQMEQEFTFLFYENHVTVKSMKASSKFNYFKFHKIYETKDNFYLYINKEYSLILNKEGFIKGNIGEFRKFIKKKCLFKYRT